MLPHNSSQPPDKEEPATTHYENESVSSENSGCDPSEKGQWHSSLHNEPQKVNPNLSLLKEDPDSVNPSDQEELEEEATKYINEDWPPFQRPPPYELTKDLFLVLAADPQKELQKKIISLKKQIQLEQEHQELII